MAMTNFAHAPIASGDSDSALDLLVEEGAREEAQQGPREKYGKVLLVAALVLSSFACGAAFAKNVSGVPARSSGDRAVDLAATAAEWGTEMSANSAGKPWASIAQAFNQVASGNGTNGGNITDPALSQLATYLSSASLADRKVLVAALETSALTASMSGGGGVSMSMFGPLQAAFKTIMATTATTAAAAANATNATNSTR